LAEWPDRIKKLFLTEELNEEGIQAMALFIKGKPEVITVNTDFPWKSA
jgi:hypothetical protein